jgi:hypothetical protein
VTVSVKTWKEKQIEKEEESDESDNDSVGKGSKNQRNVEVNMVFHLPVKFSLPESGVARLKLGAKRAIFEKPVELEKHMKPLYIRGHLDGVPTNRMLIDGGTCVNIMTYTVFERLSTRRRRS